MRSRRFSNLLIAAAAALTAVLAARTFWYLFHSVSNVPYPDLWVLLREVENLRTGQSGWSYLWSPYWGHRPLIPRLFILFCAVYLRYPTLPFTVTNVIAQATSFLLLLSMIRRLFPNHRSPLFWLSAVAAANLLFSALQMEVFVLGTEIEYTIGYATAFAAITVLGPARPRFMAAIFLGLISTACLPVSILVWPILMIEAWLLDGRIKHVAVLAAIFAAAIIAYSIGYTRPAMGMGLAGFIRHPLEAFGVAAMLLGGSIIFFSRFLGTAIGGFGLVAAVVFIVCAWRSRSAKPSAVALMCVAFFLIASPFAIAFGRVTGDVFGVHGALPVPSRYMMPTLAFWAALFPVALAFWSAGRLVRVVTLGVCAAVLTLAFGTWNWQWMLPRAWAVISERYDAVASGFLMNVPDPAEMSPILADAQYRNHMLDYMRRERLSIFAEPRSRWFGHSLGSIGPASTGTICRGAVTNSVSVSSEVLRVGGKITIDGRPTWRRLDIVMTGAGATVQGLARTLPIQSEGQPATDFLGYVRGVELKDVRLFVVLPGGGVCAVQTTSMAIGPNRRHPSIKSM